MIIIITAKENYKGRIKDIGKCLHFKWNSHIVRFGVIIGSWCPMACVHSACVSDSPVTVIKLT